MGQTGSKTSKTQAKYKTIASDSSDERAGPDTLDAQFPKVAAMSSPEARLVEQEAYRTHLDALDREWRLENKLFQATLVTADIQGTVFFSLFAIHTYLPWQTWFMHTYAQSTFFLLMFTEIALTMYQWVSFLKSPNRTREQFWGLLRETFFKIFLITPAILLPALYPMAHLLSLVARCTFVGVIGTLALVNLAQYLFFKREANRYKEDFPELHEGYRARSRFHLYLSGILVDVSAALFFLIVLNVTAPLAMGLISGVSAALSITFLGYNLKNHYNMAFRHWFQKETDDEKLDKMWERNDPADEDMIDAMKEIENRIDAFMVKPLDETTGKGMPYSLQRDVNGQAVQAKLVPQVENQRSAFLASLSDLALQRLATTQIVTVLRKSMENKMHRLFAKHKGAIKLRLHPMSHEVASPQESTPAEDRAVARFRALQSLYQDFFGDVEVPADPDAQRLEIKAMPSNAGTGFRQKLRAGREGTDRLTAFHQFMSHPESKIGKKDVTVDDLVRGQNKGSLIIPSGKRKRATSMSGIFRMSAAVVRREERLLNKELDAAASSGWRSAAGR